MLVTLTAGWVGGDLYILVLKPKDAVRSSGYKLNEFKVRKEIGKQQAFE